MNDLENIVIGVTENLNKRTAEQNRGISVQELNDMIDQNLGNVNCYPGVEDGTCHQVAFFISLSSKRYLGTGRKKGHLTFSQILTELVRHMQGHCPDKTRHAILITDNWQPDVYNAWKANIDQITKTKTVDIYLIDPKNCNKIIV